MMKKDNLKYSAGIVAIMVFLVLFFSSLLLKREKCNKLDCLSFPSKKSYKIKEVFIDQEGSFLAEYFNENSNLRVEVINQNKDEADNLIKSRIARIQGQYEDSISPYPGEISDSISCPFNFKPKITIYEENDINISSFLVKLNERKVTGQCDEDLIKYHSYNYYFHCLNQNKTFFIERIYEKNFEDVEAISFTCN